MCDAKGGGQVIQARVTIESSEAWAQSHLLLRLTVNHSAVENQTPTTAFKKLIIFLHKQLNEGKSWGHARQKKPSKDELAAGWL